MAQTLLNDFLGSSSQELENHLTLYLGDDGLRVFQSSFEISPSNDSLSLIIDDEVDSIISSETSTRAYLQKNGENFLFCIIAIPGATQTLSAFFPHMLPDESGSNSGQILEPVMANLTPQNIQWLYIFFSDPDAPVNSTLWDAVLNETGASELDSIVQGKNELSLAQNRIDYLKHIARMAGDQAFDSWQGGLFYFASFPELPFPELDDSNKGFLTLSDTLGVGGFVVHGCISYPRYFPRLNFQVPLLDVKSDGVSGSVTLQLSAPALRFEAKDRNLGIIGDLTIGDDLHLEVQGIWPLDGDFFQVKSAVRLDELSFFDHGGFPMLGDIHPDLELDLDLDISKSDAALERLNFGFEVDNWVLLRDVFTLKKLRVDLTLLRPRDWNLQMAEITARVEIGESEVNCRAFFPSGQFSFELDPHTPVHLHDLVVGVMGSSGGLAKDLEISEFAGEFDLSRYYLSLRASLSTSSDKTWNPGDHDFELSRISLSIFGVESYQAKLLAQVSLAGSVFEVIASFDEGWAFTATHSGNLAISRLIAALGADKGNIPPFLQHVEIGDINLTFNTRSKDFQFSGKGVLTDPITASILIEVQLLHGEGDTFEKHFAGQLKVGDRQFDLLFDSKKPKSRVLLGVYQKPGGEHIALNDLLGAVVPDAPSLPGVDFSVKNALISILKGESTNGDANTKYLFASDIDFGIDLSGLGDLPLIGKEFGSKSPLKLAFQPILSSKDNKAFTPEEIGQIQGLLPAGSPVIPEGIAGGVALITTVQLGNFQKELSLGLKPADVNERLTESEQATGSDDDRRTENERETQDVDDVTRIRHTGVRPNAEAGGTPAEENSETTELNKSIGALHLSNLQLSFQDGAINAGLDASMMLGPLSIALQGLGATYVLKTKDLSFRLEGLGVSLKKDPLEISGAFLKFEDEFVGKVTIKAESFALGALGAFGQYDFGPSMFLYAFLDYPLGGPIFFFVEGLALGFGYNRSLTIPEIQEIHSFPLISEVIGSSPPPNIPTSPEAGSDPTQALRQEFALLEKYIRPEAGQYFLAVGLKFSSFETLECFALLSVSFGNRLEIGLMGVASMAVPTKVETPVAEVELEFSVRILPAEGFVGVQANLTPNSYILSTLCRLQGGFAFFSWFSGPHGGDFALTLGGYHPKFKVPTHYPQPAVVPRLGFTWRLSDNLSIKGGAYFALCPKAMMLGGKLDARFKEENDLFSVNAWFIVGADFLVYWKPFHYEAHAFVEIGADVVVNVLVCTAEINISAGADVRIWGPEFAGTAEVHASVFGIDVDFDVDFGNTQPAATPKLSWDQFNTSFLPDNPLSVSVSSGLISTVKTGDVERWVINGKEFHLNISSLVPVNKPVRISPAPKNVAGADWDIANATKVDVPDGSTPVNEDVLNIKPMESEVSESTIAVRLFRDGKVMADASEHIAFIPIKKQFPQALWASEPANPASKPVLNGEQMVARTGAYSLVPKDPPKPFASHSYSVNVLSFEAEKKPLAHDQGPHWHYMSEKATVKSLLPETLLSHRTRRNQMLTTLGFDVNEVVDMQPDLFESYVFVPQLVEHFDDTFDHNPPVRPQRFKKR